MLHVVKTMNLILKRMPLVCGLLFAAVLALLPISAGAQCSARWDASGGWWMVQRGQANHIGINLKQKGRVLTGTAVSLEGNADTVGTIDGTIDGDTINFQIFWPDHLTGVYNGKILPSGRVEGETYDKNNTRHRQPWRSEGVLKCAPAPPPKVLRSTGRKPSMNQTSLDHLFPALKTAAPEPKPPFINAGQVVIPTPSHPFGIVSLGWDGGPDHPNVEVFVSIDDGVEIPAFAIGFAPQHPVFKQPKVAALTLNLERRKHYKFSLKGVGKTLAATAAFVVP